MKEMHDTVTTLFREGPSKEALEHANYSYKKEYSRLFLKHHIRVGWVKRKRTHQNKWCPFTGFWVLGSGVFLFTCGYAGNNNFMVSNYSKLTNNKK